MISKPLHVERLLKVLTELFNVAPNYDPPDIPPKTDLMYQYQPQFTTSGGSSLFQVCFERLIQLGKIEIYFSQKQLPRKMKSRLVIIKYAGYFLAVVFAVTIDIEI